MDNKDWGGNSKTAFSQLGASNHADTEREVNDFYATDPNSLKLFLEAINKDNIQLHNKIWECACGQGHLSEVLKENGYDVWSTDIIDRGYGEGGVDFLTCLPGGRWMGDILTNPPYKYAKEFVEHGLELIDDDNYVVMFLKIQFLESKQRLGLFKKNPPMYIYIHSSRQTCYINGDMSEKKSSAMCLCWYIWKKGFKGEPIIRWIP